MSFVEQFTKARILCVGDVMMDEFISGTVRRISPESPVPVLSVESTTHYPGGAANVARNIAALGGHCTLIGLVGEDAMGERLVADLKATGTIVPAFVASGERPTSTKTRFVAHGQHMLRADREIATPVGVQTASALVERIAAEIAHHDVLLLSDYAKGVLTEAVVREAITLGRRQGIPVVVDPKTRDFNRYRGASVMTPNAKEIEVATGVDAMAGEDGAVAAGKAAMEQAGVEAILITRAEKGMTLVCGSAPALHIPASAREVFDVVGAGDTAIATLALALGVGAGLAEAARLSNLAAGIAVGRHGTSTVSQSELLMEAGKAGTGAFDHAAKILSPGDAQARVALWKRDGLKVGFTNGCFDILHVGHIRILEFARAHCDRLVLGLNSDASVRRLKGPSRPVNSEMDRAEVMAALGVIDAVVVFDEDTPQVLIEQLTPDVLVKGADYTIAQIVGADHVLAHGGEVLRFELVPGKSTTGVIARSRRETAQ